MQVLTFKAKPKFIFGAILCAAGVLVVLITFLSNHSAKPAALGQSAVVSSDSQRAQFLSSFGWEFDSSYTKKEVTIPKEFNDVYSEYNKIQKAQGCDLEKYCGKTVELYTYRITNYPQKENDYIYANILVYNGNVIGGDVCSTAKDGFMHGFKIQNR